MTNNKINNVVALLTCVVELKLTKN